MGGGEVRFCGPLRARIADSRPYLNSYLRSGVKQLRLREVSAAMLLPTGNAYLLLLDLRV